MTTRTSARTVSCWALLLGLPLISEGVLRALYTQNSHTFEQRQSEVYGWFAVACLLLVLVARPLKLLRQRRMLGVSAFVFSAIHTWLAYQAVFDGDWESMAFLSKPDWWATWAGIVALIGFVPLTLTSTNTAMRLMGKHWKTLHRLGPPLTLMALAHTLWMGVHFGLDPLKWTSVLLILLTVVLFVWRTRKEKTA
ncbi:ferric reductase-like transmembrane domain-containing protein [Deinococcus cellulosilyticus]|nr:ferric reductase-like transmembrane domain-containing protein [Deinococcus cellulosilyticus]